MMFRCAARIKAGSAFASAVTAAARSPVLIASSTLRTAPRIWVRRDLLTAVRRAILRVAFLAEVVLAMVSMSFAGTGRGLVGERRLGCPRNRRSELGCSVPRLFPEHERQPCGSSLRPREPLSPRSLHLLKEQRRQD